MQADTVDLGELFAYTAVDIFTRETAVVLGDNLSDEEGAKCVGQILESLGPCQIFQTDNGSEFAYECEKTIRKFALRHRKIHARRKNENAYFEQSEKQGSRRRRGSYIESFHRSLKKECLGWIKYRKQDKEKLQALINTYLVHYHTQRPHLGLGLKTPAEVTMLHLR